MDKTAIFAAQATLSNGLDWRGGLFLELAV